MPAVAGMMPAPVETTTPSMPAGAGIVKNTTMSMPAVAGMVPAPVNPGNFRHVLVFWVTKCSILFPWRRTGASTAVGWREVLGSCALCPGQQAIFGFRSLTGGLPDLADGMITYFTAPDPLGRALIFGW